MLLQYLWYLCKLLDRYGDNVEFILDGNPALLVDLQRRLPGYYPRVEFRLKALYPNVARYIYANSAM